MTTLKNYHLRMQRVLDYIDAHLDDDLDLDTLSGVAAFSKFHFHRQFKASFGLSVHRYVQLARMRRASFQLAHSGAQSVTDIAIDAGYDAPDAFARAFRQRVGQSPSSFRKSPDWAPWLTAFGPSTTQGTRSCKITYEPGDVTIREVLPTPVAIFEHRGDREPTAGDDRAVSSPGARLPAYRLLQRARPSTSSDPSVSPRTRPTTAWTCAWGPIGPSTPRMGTRNRASFPAALRGAAGCPQYEQPRSLRRFTSIASGFRTVARKHGISRSIASVTSRCPRM